MMFLNISFTDGLIISFISILIVFLILIIVASAVASLQFMHPQSLPQKTPNPPFSLESITDDTMMVAALVAAIEHREATKTDVKIISIKEISQ
ncbi:MAG: hypothetical protein PHW40_01980 [Candidatus Izemoplasmatales bacterium]|nr:hypothetical protein [Candidatus Izemoplasmatales bacterium]MDD5293065.1 hypothetical protein [Candidatus Izemoplasmatales bacterium]